MFGNGSEDFIQGAPLGPRRATGEAGGGGCLAKVPDGVVQVLGLLALQQLLLHLGLHGRGEQRAHLAGPSQGARLADRVSSSSGPAGREHAGHAGEAG